MAFLALVGVSSGTGYLAVRPSPPLSPPAQPVGLIPDQPAATFYDLGQGEVVDAEFRLTNRYPAPIDITTVDTSCGCQVASVSQHRLRPGDQATLAVRWRVGASRGPVAKPVWVVFTDPDGQVQRLPLALRAEVTPDVRCEPARLDLPAGQAATARLKLSPGRLPAFAVKSVYANQRSVTARWLPATSEVEITYTPEGGDGPGPGVTVTVETDSPNEPRLEVPVHVGPRAEF